VGSGRGPRPRLSIDPIVTTAIDALQTIRSPRSPATNQGGDDRQRSRRTAAQHHSAEVMLTGTIRTFRPEMSTLAERGCVRS
jgi:hypothetical protein